MPMPKLSIRALNRATLARQMLLERSDRGIVDSIEFLGGLQAQQSNDPYIGLWTRLNGFTVDQLTALIVGRTLLRATTMRGTLHLHSVADMVGFRALVQGFLHGQWSGGFRKRIGGEDKAKVLRAAIRLIDKEPMTAGALQKRLSPKFPTAEPLSLTTLLQSHETLIQIPPTRLWGNGKSPMLQRIERYLPEAPKPALSRVELVRRYLAAYGPASVNDMQTWCRLTKLSAEFETIRDELVLLEDEDGRPLYDLPDAPRPDEDTPAPVRFLPLYDNVYLGYDDRRRMLSPATAHLINMFQAFKPAVLIDGQINAGWVIGNKKGAATLEIETYRKMLKRETAELEREGLAFARFMEPDASRWAVTFVSKA
jgi:hypothetical protein